MFDKSQPLSAFNPEKNQIGYLLHQVDKYILCRHNDALKVFGINFHCAIALNYIVEHESEGSINQRAIESYTGLTNPAITKIITALVELGLAARQTDAKDRRNHSLVSTEAGRALSAKCHQSIVETDKDCFSSLNKSDQKELIRLLCSLDINK